MNICRPRSQADCLETLKAYSNCLGNVSATVNENRKKRTKFAKVQLRSIDVFL